MKLASGLLVVLCCGLASAFTGLIQAGTSAVGGAVTGCSSLVNSGLDTAGPLTSGLPMADGALSAVRRGTTMASSAATSSLAVVDTATTIAGYVHYMMTNPYLFWILSETGILSMFYDVLLKLSKK